MTRARHLAGYTVIAALSATAPSPALATQANASPAPASDLDTSLSGLAVPAMIQPADWIYKPGAGEFMQLLPGRFQRMGVAGKVVLKCRVLANTQVKDCSVLSDTEPTGALGQTAVEASILFRIKPRTVNGTLSDTAWVTIPLSFDVQVIKQGEAASQR